MDVTSLAAQLVVLPASVDDVPKARACAARLGVDLLPPATDPVEVCGWPLLLVCAAQGLQLRQSGPQAPGPVMVDFVSGAVGHRRRFGGGGGQHIAKAVGVKAGVRPRVADVTAGLGRDSFVLATLGCEVTLIERSPVISMLLADGIEQGRRDVEVAEILARMTLLEYDAIDWLQQLKASAAATGFQPPQVVYLDPMFPHSNKSAEVKKEMRLFRQLIGADDDAGQLLQAALAVAQNRVVVKRPRKAPSIAGPEPGFKIEGKSGRFDVYPLKRF